jgi:hypothetical protein
MVYWYHLSSNFRTGETRRRELLKKVKPPGFVFEREDTKPVPSH